MRPCPTRSGRGITLPLELRVRRCLPTLTWIHRWSRVFPCIVFERLVNNFAIDNTRKLAVYLALSPPWRTRLFRYLVPNFLLSGASLSPETNPALAAAIQAAIRPLEQQFSETIIPAIGQEARFAGGLAGAGPQTGVMNGMKIAASRESFRPLWYNAPLASLRLPVSTFLSPASSVAAGL